MKTINLKNVVTTISVIATLSFSALVIAGEEVNLPAISKPSILEEGTQREMSAAQIAELLPWAKNSKVFLNDMLDNIQSLSATDKIERLITGIQSVVNESAPKNSELLMRYALNRGLVINDILTRETSEDVVGTADAKLRVLVESVKMAIKYYDTDMAILTKKTKAPFVAFGVDYNEFLAELNKSVFDASAQYIIQRTSLEWLQWDLFRDLNNATYAPQIVKINNALKLFPLKKLTDAQSIAYIRQLKALSLQLKIKSVSLENDKASRDAEEARTIAGRNEKAKLKIGDKVIHVSKYLNATAKIAAIQENGSYAIRYDNGVITSNIIRENLAVTNGCSERFCTGEKVINIVKSQYNITIAGIQMDGKYILQFNSGDLDGQRGAGWESKELVKLSGCNPNGFCVGDKVINLPRNATATVIGIQEENKYFLMFTSTELNGKSGDSWTKSDLVKDNL